MPAHQVSPQAYQAFVNPCCATFASRRYRAISLLFSEPSPTAPFINISCRSCSFPFFSLFSLCHSLSLYIFLFDLSVLLAKEKRFICLHIYLAKHGRKLSRSGISIDPLLQRDSCFFVLATVLIERRQCSFLRSVFLIVYYCTATVSL